MRQIVNHRSSCPHNILERRNLQANRAASEASGSYGLVLEKLGHHDVDVDRLLPTDMDVRRSLELATKDDMLKFWIGKMRKQSVAFFTYENARDD